MRHLFFFFVVVGSGVSVASSMILAEKAHAAASAEVRQIGGPGKFVQLSCVDASVGIVFSWNSSVGESGQRLRHLLFPLNTDMHFLLPVLPDSFTTGFVEGDGRAQALVEQLYWAAKRSDENRRFHFEVFPAGRDKVTGRWIGLTVYGTPFVEAVESLASECDWNISQDTDTPLPMVAPGAPYEK